MASCLHRIFPTLYHFRRRSEFGVESLIPNMDGYSQMSSVLEQRALELYGDKPFLQAFPVDSDRKWMRSGQYDATVENMMKDHKGVLAYEVGKWKIYTRNMDLSKMLIRDTVFYCPKEIGFDFSKMKTDEQRRKFEEAKIRCFNSVIPLTEYRNTFRVPEILLPFGVPMTDARLKKTYTID